MSTSSMAKVFPLCWSVQKDSTGVWGFLNKSSWESSVRSSLLTLTVYSGCLPALGLTQDVFCKFHANEGFVIG